MNLKMSIRNSRGQLTMTLRGPVPPRPVQPELLMTLQLQPDLEPRQPEALDLEFSAQPGSPAMAALRQRLLALAGDIERAQSAPCSTDATELQRFTLALADLVQAPPEAGTA